MGRHLRAAIVVGGGSVAARKVEGLLAAGAGVKVISPELTEELTQLVAAGRITHERRAFAPGDLEGATLVIAATDDGAVNEAVSREAEERGCLVNVVDDARHSNFTLPSVMRRGDLTVAVSTGGGSPALARRLRERLEQVVGPEYGVLTEILAELRPELQTAFERGAERMRAALRVVDSDILEVIAREGREAGLKYGRGKLYEK